MDSYEGIIIKQISYKESSKIIYLYTSSGLISLLVHGAKKLSSPYLRLTENLNLIKVFATGKGLKTLTDGEVLNDYTAIKSDLDKVAYVSHLVELIMTYSESEYDHQKLYDFVLKILDKISESKSYIRYIYMFEIKYLYMLGIAPNFKRCVVCNKTDALRFSIKSGGYCCNEHYPENEKTYSDNAILTLSKLYYHDMNQPLDITIDQVTGIEIRSLLDEYYLYHLSFQSKSRKVLSGLLGY